MRGTLITFGDELEHDGPSRLGGGRAREHGCFDATRSRSGDLATAGA